MVVFCGVKGHPGVVQYIKLFRILTLPFTNNAEQNWWTIRSGEWKIQGASDIFRRS